MLWPGAVSPDAALQYKAAVSGVYSDHHPPAMSLLWRYLDRVYPGSGLLFSFHLAMLYLSAAIFVYIFRQSKFKWWYAVYPIIPNMLAYTSLIVKDTSFTYSYLLAGALLAFLMVNHQRRYKLIFLTAVLLLLFYGSAVKFQAKFLLFCFTTGIGYCLSNYKLDFRAILTGAILAIALLLAVIGLNSKLVPLAQEQHTWQYVKLYDLSAISIDLNKPLYPEFVLQQPGFSFTKVQELFNPQEVDPLVFHSDALHGGVDAKQREELWQYWFATIKQHPWLYLKIRARLWAYNFTTAPSGRTDPLKYFANTGLGPLVSQPLVAKLITGSYQIISSTFKFIWLLPLLVLYTCLGIWHFKRARHAPPLLMFSLTSVLLLGILLFFSMAATARYVFLCTCLVHASHGFAYRAYKLK